MSEDRRARNGGEHVRDLILDLIGTGERRAKAELLAGVARRLACDPAERRLRMRVAAALRQLEADGVLVDGGPEVYRR